MIPNIFTTFFLILYHFIKNTTVTTLVNTAATDRFKNPSEACSA